MNSDKMKAANITKKHTCIVGIGNTLRSDDGAGAYVCRLLENVNVANVTIITTHQLDIGMTEELANFERVIFVDASLDEDSFSLKPLEIENNPASSSSHQINAGMLVSLARQLYTTETRFYICAIGAHNLDIGNDLSEKTTINANEAAALITKWIL